MDVGDTFTDEGFSSWTFDPAVALSFEMKREATLIVAKIPKDTKLFYIDGLLSKGYLFQAEVIFDKGGSIRALSKETVNHFSSPPSSGKTELCIMHVAFRKK